LTIGESPAPEDCDESPLEGNYKNYCKHSNTERVISSCYETEKTSVMNKRKQNKNLHAIGMKYMGAVV
jgi:hypothetical protein